MNIKISSHSQELIKEYWVACGMQPLEPSSIDSNVDLKTLLSWLNEEQTQVLVTSKEKQRRIEWIIVSLRTELLQDLYASMKGDDVKKAKQDKNTPEMSKVKFTLLTVAGILVAGCQGFDGIVTMLSIFTMPSLILTVTGFAFSLLSIVVFCGVDLVKVSNSLGVKISDTYKLLDAYLLQLQNIKVIRKKIDDYNLAELSQDDFKKLEQIISTLQKRYLSLTEASKQFEEALNSSNMKLAKTLFTGVSALLFFGGGFFAGQSVALFVSSLFINSVIPAFWPMIIFSTIVGLAALSIYWCVERPGVNRLVSSWFGLQEDDVEKLCDKDLLAKEAKKLERLHEKVSSMTRLAGRLTQLEQEINAQEVDASEEENTEGAIDYRTATDTRVSASFYSFHKPQKVFESDSLRQPDLGAVASCPAL